MHRYVCMCQSLCACFWVSGHMYVYVCKWRHKAGIRSLPQLLYIVLIEGLFCNSKASQLALGNPHLLSFLY